jgi:hypothetical protein
LNNDFANFIENINVLEENGARGEKIEWQASRGKSSQDRDGKVPEVQRTVSHENYFGFGDYTPALSKVKTR